MVGRTDAASPEALTSPGASRRFVGAITDGTILAILAIGAPRKNWQWRPYTYATMATRSMGVHPLRQGGTDSRSLGAS